jgi:hypothetical protein
LGFNIAQSNEASPRSAVAQDEETARTMGINFTPSSHHFAIGSGLAVAGDNVFSHNEPLWHWLYRRDWFFRHH